MNREWTASVQPNEEQISEKLLTPLRVSAADPPDKRQQAAVAAVEAANFRPDPHVEVAVLAAFDRTEDPAARKAAGVLRRRHVRDKGTELSAAFFDLSSSERRSAASALASATTSAATRTHYEGLADLAGIKPPRESTPGTKAQASLATLEPVDAARLAAECVVKGIRQEGVSNRWPGNEQVRERYLGAPTFLVPKSRVELGESAEETPSGPITSPASNWRVVWLCLLVIYFLIRAVVVFGDASERDSGAGRPMPDVTRGLADG